MLFCTNCCFGWLVVVVGWWWWWWWLVGGVQKMGWGGGGGGRACEPMCVLACMRVSNDMHAHEAYMDVAVIVKRLDM